MLLRERVPSTQYPVPRKKAEAKPRTRESQRLRDKRNLRDKRDLKLEKVRAGTQMETTRYSLLGTRYGLYSVPTSIDRLQFLPRLEAHRLARRNRDFSTGARIAPDSGLARAHIKHAKPPQFNAIAVGQSL